MKAPILPPHVVQLIGTILIKVVSGGLEWHRLVEEKIGTQIRVISSSFGHFLLSYDCFKFWWGIGNVGVGNKSLGLWCYVPYLGPAFPPNSTATTTSSSVSSPLPTPLVATSPSQMGSSQTIPTVGHDSMRSSLQSRSSRRSSLQTQAYKKRSKLELMSETGYTHESEMNYCQRMGGLFKLLRCREFFISVDHHSIWRRHLAWSLRDGGKS